MKTKAKRRLSPIRGGEGELAYWLFSESQSSERLSVPYQAPGEIVHETGSDGRTKVRGQGG